MKITQRVNIKIGMLLGLMSLSVASTASTLTSAPLMAKASTQAESVRPNQEQEIKNIERYLVEQLKIQVENIQISEIANFYQVMTNKGILYISADKRYMFYGDLYDLQGGVTNITKGKRGHFLAKKLVAFEKDMIVYKAPKEKYVVTVFTDTSCGYCKKLHQELDDYLKAGITIRYLAFPRGGRQSGNFDEMQSVWCSKKPQEALTAAKKGLPIAKVTLNLNCDDIIKQYDLGLLFDVRGTPAIVLDSGEMLPGYVPAKQLLAQLDQKK
ncbi:MAG: bifunctional protein-disulfide isomerase/oxidoreductase DsbC [Shewanellaceae bacterium]|nr:bifunctional protein-disulfide isomerase/oxidoreductase DsbC [Shewanellaceae bacterium]